MSTLYIPIQYIHTVHTVLYCLSLGTNREVYNTTPPHGAILVPGPYPFNIELV